MKKYIGNVVMTTLVGGLCYICLEIAKAQLWEDAGVGWLGKCFGIGCVIICMLTILMIWSNLKKEDNRNEDA